MLQVPDPQLGLVVRGLARAWGEKQYAETPFAWHSCWTPACQGLNTFLTAPCPSWLSFALDPLGPVPCPSPPPPPPMPPRGRLAARGAEGAPRALGSQFCGNKLLAAY